MEELALSKYGTVVVNRYKEEFDVYIGRPGIWGNPFGMPPFKRDEAIRRFRDWILTQPGLLESLPSLRGKRLGCFCKPQACHGDVLVELSDMTAEELAKLVQSRGRAH